jgi:hypothetical protein
LVELAWRREAGRSIWTAMPRAVDAMLGPVSGERGDGVEKRTSARVTDIHEDDERVEHDEGLAP